MGNGYYAKSLAINPKDNRERKAIEREPTMARVETFAEFRHFAKEVDYTSHLIRELPAKTRGSFASTRYSCS